MPIPLINNTRPKKAAIDASSRADTFPAACNCCIAGIRRGITMTYNTPTSFKCDWLARFEASAAQRINDRQFTLLCRSNRLQMPPEEVECKGPRDQQEREQSPFLRGLYFAD